MLKTTRRCAREKEREFHLLDQVGWGYSLLDGDLYIERSPIHFTEKLNCPMIIFQGLEDKVVPPNQAEKMAEAVRAKKLPVAYLAFAGEQHGFRKAENIKRVLDAELYFYSKVFGFELAEPIDQVEIENLQEPADV